MSRTGTRRRNSPGSLLQALPVFVDTQYGIGKYISWRIIAVEMYAILLSLIAWAGGMGFSSVLSRCCVKQVSAARKKVIFIS